MNPPLTRPLPAHSCTHFYPKRARTQELKVSLRLQANKFSDGESISILSVVQAAVRLAANSRLAPCLAAAGFVDACCLGVLRTISTSPSTSTLGLF